MKGPHVLRSTALPWLLEPENPSIRYRTLTELLDRPTNDPEVRAAREAIPTSQPVAGLLAAQKQDGYWVKRDYYLPKHYGTFWVLSLLADMGLDKEDEQTRRGCEYIFSFQRDHGAFCRRRRVPGRGGVWDEQPEPCTHARIVRFLVQFGYTDDPRTQAGERWLLSTQRADGTWHCHREARYGCLRATLDVLRVAVLDPETAAQPGIGRAASFVYDLLMEPHMSRYHVGGLWTTLEYPPFGYSVIGALDALARLGYTLDQPKIAGATDYLLSRKLPDGTWPLDQSPHHPPLAMGEPGEPNKWLTLDALRVMRLLGREDMA